MAREQLEHLQSIFETAAAGKLLSEHRLRLCVVGIGAEHECVANYEAEPSRRWRALQTLARAIALPTKGKHRPVGKGPGHLDNIVLRIAAVDAERVKLEELAGEILIQSSRPVVLLRSLHPPGTSSSASTPSSRGPTELGHPHVSRRPHPVVRGRLGIVEIQQHGRMGGRLDQELSETSQHARPDGIALIGQQMGSSLIVGHRNVEVVEPEVGEHRLELTLRVHSLKQFVRHELPNQLLLSPVSVLLVKLQKLAVLGSSLSFLRGTVGRQDTGLLGLAMNEGREREGPQYLLTRHTPGVQHGYLVEELRIVDRSL